MINGTWQKNSQNNEWFDLLRLDLSAPYFQGRKGVFVVWYIGSGSNNRTIRVGSGNIAEQLSSLRANPVLLEFTKNGPLKVSWVAVNGALKDEDVPGVELYLYNKYGPLLGQKPIAPEEKEITLIGN